MRRRLRGALGALAPGVVVLAFAGCGGDDDGGAATTAGGGEPSLTKAEFIAAADEICRGARSESESLQGRLNALAQGRGNTPEELDEAARLLRQLAEVNQSIIRQIGELREPSEDREVVARLLATGERSVELSRNLAGAYANASENPAQSRIPDAAAALGKTAAKSRRIARGYGFEVCGGRD